MVPVQDEGGGDPELAELMRRIEDPSFFSGPSGLAPELSTSASVTPPLAGTGAASSTGAGTGAGARAGEALERSGWLALPDAARAREAALLADAIEALVERGLPPLFVYAFDEAWQLGESARAAIARVTGAEYELVADAWAFRVAPGRGHRGWSAHRGSYELAAERRAPDLVNVWVALTDATVDNGCMHVVELDDDPAYPDALRAEPTADAEGRGRPVPAAAGTLLAWNANVLHWGGESSERARGPRTSVTFTLARTGGIASRAAGGTPRVDLARLGHRARLDLLADQVVLYGELERTLPDVVKRWASLTVALRKTLGGR